MYYGKEFVGSAGKREIERCILNFKSKPKLRIVVSIHRLNSYHFYQRFKILIQLIERRNPFKRAYTSHFNVSLVSVNNERGIIEILILDSSFKFPGMKNGWFNVHNNQ